jgi:hypothetical protein
MADMRDQKKMRMGQQEGEKARNLRDFEVGLPTW